MQSDMQVRHVFFDVNGTLFDPSVVEEPLGEERRGFADQLLADAVTLAMAESLTGGYRDFSELIRAAAARGLELIDRAELLDAVTAKIGEMAPFEEAGEALRLLNEAGISTGALSNSSKQSVESLADGSDLPLSPIIGTDAVRAFKPHPDVYAAAVSAVEAQPQEVALVTVHSWDAIGAKRAGLCAAWVSRKEGLPLQLDERFDFAANDLAEAARLILTREPRSAPATGRQADPAA